MSGAEAVKLYWLRPDESYDYDVEAEHRWCLPGVHCDLCSVTWGAAGVAYPTVDLSGLPNAGKYIEPWPVSWSVFEALRSAITRLLPEGAPAPPGTGLGPLVGTARGRCPQFAWPNSWTVLLQKDIWSGLAACGIHVAGARAELRTRLSTPEFVELQIVPHGRIARVSFPGGVHPIACARCGRTGLKRPKHVVVDRASVQDAPALFRLADHSTMIVARADVVTTFQSLDLRGTQYIELDVT